MNKKPYFDDEKRFCHPCSVADCTKEGCIGVGVSLLKGKLGQWYCGPHYRELEKTDQKKKLKPRLFIKKNRGDYFK